jgi:hypothetical protein
MQPDGTGERSSTGRQAFLGPLKAIINKPTVPKLHQDGHHRGHFRRAW